ncbi:MAG TPA: LysR family transcriptional regulator [Microbacterium sp.]|uniref:LysR family transcriptional regulator n=1 Tax=Microbacterium sp. TaxID=51671 RepID=UPI002CE0428D|nr:LysR family transcriptional regulator [Microbacterium sp.]HWI31370.1 LysR family transcriptional regulator [Microbacterium sp.]
MDLNLVRTFVAIYEHRSLTAAANELFVSQPAVSQALARLRHDLDDPLFTRVGRFVEPSPLAQEVYAEFRAALLRIDRVVDSIHGFNPAHSDRRFRLALSELGEIGYFPAILSAVRAVAPSVSLEVIPLAVDRLPDWLSRGTVDLAVTSSPVAGLFEKMTLRGLRYAALVSQDHRLTRHPLALDAYTAAAHVCVAGDSGAPMIQAALARAGHHISPEVIVNHFAALPPLVASSDLVATVPVNLGAEWLSNWPVQMLQLPFTVDPVEIRLYTRATSQHSAAVAWLRDTVFQALRDLPDDFAAITGGAPRARPSAP